MKKLVFPLLFIFLIQPVVLAQSNESDRIAKLFSDPVEFATRLKQIREALSDFRILTELVRKNSNPTIHST